MFVCFLFPNKVREKFIFCFCINYVFKKNKTMYFEHIYMHNAHVMLLTVLQSNGIFRCSSKKWDTSVDFITLVSTPIALIFFY